MTELSAPSAPAGTNQWLPTRPAAHSLINGSRAGIPRQLCQSGSLPPVPVEVGRSKRKCTRTALVTAPFLGSWAAPNRAKIADFKPITILANLERVVGQLVGIKS